MSSLLSEFVNISEDKVKYSFFERGPKELINKFDFVKLWTLIILKRKSNNRILEDYLNSNLFHCFLCTAEAYLINSYFIHVKKLTDDESL